MKWNRTQPKTGAMALCIGRIQQANDCSILTAEMIACTSWGLYQPLGEVLYGDLGLAVPIMEFWSTPPMQTEYFTKDIDRRGLYFSTYGELRSLDWCKDFARRYNGPGNVDDYAAKLQAAAVRLGVYADVAQT